MITMLPAPTPPSPFRPSAVPSPDPRRSPDATPEPSQIAPRQRPHQPIGSHQLAIIMASLALNLPTGSSYRVFDHPPR